MKFQPPKGTRDFLPEEMVLRKYIVETIEKLFQTFGFKPMDTPAFEMWKLLSAKGGGGEEIKDEIYYFRDKSDRELGLRFDLTVPLARIVANNPQIPKPFKRYQIGKVWRYDNPQAGRFREFLQADADIVGSEKMECEAECLALACSVLKQLGFNNFTIRLNNRKILNSMVKLIGVEDKENLFRIIDKIEKIGRENVLKQLKGMLSEKQIREIKRFISMKGKPMDMISKGKELLEDIEIAEEGLAEIEEIITLAKVYGIADKIVVDFSLVRGLDYYTGPIYEIVINEKGSIKSAIAGGGRYDKLIALYGGEPVPATGFSFGVERIFELMKRKVDMRSTYTKIFVAVTNEKFKKDAIKIAGRLRNMGIETEIDVMGRNLKKQLNYVNINKIPYTVFIGERELKEKKITLRDMKTGKEKKVKIEDIGKMI